MTETRLTDRRWGNHQDRTKTYQPAPEELEAIDTSARNILYCALQTFEQRMAQLYPDWHEFIAWTNQHQFSMNNENTDANGMNSMNRKRGKHTTPTPHPV